jgi:putative FmdB family regulatory protein
MGNLVSAWRGRMKASSAFVKRRGFDFRIASPAYTIHDTLRAIAPRERRSGREDRYNPSLFWRIPMPIYEYRCASCGFQKEHLQKLGDAPLSVCPECGQSAYEKQLSAAGFQLKGSGWYATDFKNPPKKPASPPPCQGGSGPCPSGACASE